MKIPQKKYYFKHDHQEVFIKGLKKFKQPIEEILGKYLRVKTQHLDETRGFQYVILTIFQHFFGLVRGEAHNILSSDDAWEIKDYMLKDGKSFPGKSNSSVRMKEVSDHCRNEINDLVSTLQDFFYVSIGKKARSQYRDLVKNTRIKVTPFPEMFVGIIPPSEIFPNIQAQEKGMLIPFLNARVYMKAKEYTSQEEFIGDIKQAELDGDYLRFKLAGRLGFIKGAPGRNKFIRNFPVVDHFLNQFEEEINEILVNRGIIDMTVVSVDSTNVPVDKRDNTGSKGTGSRGTFFGHKSSIGAGTNCMPVTAVTKSGRTADSSLFPDTFDPIVSLLKTSNQSMWACTADAAYDTVAIINRIESAGAVPFVDLNPRRSILLKELKRRITDLSEHSKIAIKKGLSQSERRKCITELKSLGSKKKVPPSRLPQRKRR